MGDLPAVVYAKEYVFERGVAFFFIGFCSVVI